jgi:predicted homoserine dehydrogenase-like protein
MGLSQDCRLKRDIPKDQIITYEDVELPRGRLCDELRAEQVAHFDLCEAPAAVAQAAPRRDPGVQMASLHTC